MNTIKKALMLFFIFVSFHNLFAQGILPVDENGKVTFTEVVTLDSTYNTVLLLNNANRWAKLLRNDDKK
ncbi:MAG: hypothetical protein K2Q22_01045, partial [Cytophagales bacterium]|nr:hypothetical protein [Cytophagales bacterium]